MKIIIWGTGNIAKEILAYKLNDGVSVVAVIDSDPLKSGTKFFNYEVYSPEQIRKLEFDKIIILSSRYKYAIREQIIEMGIDYEKIVMFENYYALKYWDTEIKKFFIIEQKIEPWKPGTPKGYKKRYSETYKSKKRREREGFFDKYCKGHGLDIGWGGDLLADNCSVWDVANGDAQYLLGIDDEYFDFVYSSHCLEHMKDVRISLQNWWRVLKNEGYLIITIPDRDLYERKKELPSKWNPDHKHMFLIGKEEAPDTLDIVEEIKKSITDYEIEYIKRCRDGYVVVNSELQAEGEYQIEIVIRKVRHE